MFNIKTNRMTTADKKRILSTRSVKAEIKFRDELGAIHTVIASCLYEQNNGNPPCLIIEGRECDLNVGIHVKCCDSRLELWMGLAVGEQKKSYSDRVVYLRQKIQWKDVIILWATYQGIQKQAA